MNTQIVNGAQPNCSDTATTRGQPPHPKNMEAGEAAAQVPLQAAVAAHSIITLEHPLHAAPAAPTQAHGVAAQGVRFGGELAAYIYPLARERLPHALVHAKIWLVWRSVPKDDPSKKPDKVPYYVSGRRRHETLDSPADHAQLATFDEALDAYCSGGYDGLAIALGPDGSGNYWQGFDADNVPAASLGALMATLPGYVEVSPSGHGCHAIGYGRHFKSLGSNGSNVEAYAGGRFFTFTGDSARGRLVCIGDFVEGQVAQKHGSMPQAASAGGGTVHADPGTVADLRSALFSMRADDYGTWYRMGMALHELGDPGRGLWMDWSMTSSKFDPREAAKKWDQLHGDRTGYRAVFAEAQLRGWENPRSNAAKGLVPAPSTAAEPHGEFYALPSPKLRPEALYGILAEIAAAGSAHTEAVPAALAINTLARFCATIGGGAHVAIGDETRSLRPFVLIIGPTGMGRKGTSAQLPMRIFERVEALMGQHRIIIPPLRTETAVSSGEGLVWMVRDAKDEDPGISDKRVLLEISEFSGTLAQAKRDTSVLTAVLRDGFDGRRLTTPNKNSPCSATGAHFVTIGHITREELTALLSTTDISNGFANRFMMVYSARNKKVVEPSPTPAEVVDSFAMSLAYAVWEARQRGNDPILRSPAAKLRLASISEELESRTRAIEVQKLMARASTYIWMLSAAIALINREPVVEVRHLDAALAWVDYWEATANFCFTTAKRHDEMLLAKAVSDEIVEAVRKLGGKDVKHSAVTALLSHDGKRKDRDAKTIGTAVAKLQTEAPPRIEIGRALGKGRTAVTYSLVG